MRHGTTSFTRVCGIVITAVHALVIIVMHIAMLAEACILAITHITA
jgi:hypothetical protein